MDDALLAFLGAEDAQSAQPNGAALAKALRGRKDLGQLGLLSGDASLSSGAAADLDEAGRGENAMARAIAERLARAQATALQNSQQEYGAKENARQRAYSANEANLGRMFAAEQNALGRDNALALAMLAASGKNKSQPHEISPGIMTGSVPLESGEAAKFRAAVEIQQDLTDSVSQLRDLVSKRGSFEMGGTDGGTMQALYKHIVELEKERAKLGVIAGPDMGLIEGQVSDPSSLSSLFTRDETAMAKLDQYQKQNERALSAKINSMGLVDNRTKKDTNATGGMSIPPLSADSVNEHLDWARNNPDDPDAQEILKLIGGQ